MDPIKNGEYSSQLCWFKTWRVQFPKLNEWNLKMDDDFQVRNLLFHSAPIFRFFWGVIFYIGSNPVGISQNTGLGTRYALEVNSTCNNPDYTKRIHW